VLPVVSGRLPYNSLSGAACTETATGHHNLQHTARFGWLPSTCNCCGQGEITLAVSVDHDSLLLSLIRSLDCFFAFEVLDTVSYAQP
jgi:hypothetical protein